MRLKVSVFSFYLLLHTVYSFAQKQANWWYFERGAGIEFSNGYPLADTNANDSALNYFLNGFGYGSTSMASIADNKTGDLLFYGSGIGLFNRLHKSMPNGLPLAITPYFGQSGGGGGDSEEGCIIVPRPGHPSQYYFFFLRTATALYADGNVSGMEATLVDMDLDNGLGDVVTSYKSVFIIDSTEEKISATPHANGIDYWVMVRQGGTNNYHAFLVTESGIAGNPVTSSIGDVTTSYSAMEGNLRFNHEGNVLVHLRCCPDIMEVIDFDNATGQLSNLRQIDPLAPVGAGVEFSADDSRLYTGGPIQFDMTTPTAGAIAASEISLSSNFIPFMAGLQIGPDGKIYGVAFSSSTLAPYMEVIHNPNALGAACNHQDSAVYLEGRQGEVSVPQFLSSYFVTNFYADTVCVGQAAEFYINFTFIDSVFWNFGDPASGANNTDTALAPTHVFSDTGVFTVTLIAQNGVKTDTVIKNIYVKDVPKLNLGPNQDLCSTGNDTVVFHAGLPTKKLREGIYNWSNGSTDSTLVLTKTDLVTSPTEIRLAFTNECGSDQDTALVYLSKPLQISLNNVQTCEDSVVITANIDSNQSPISAYWINSVGDTIATEKQNNLVSAVSMLLPRPNAAPGILEVNLIVVVVNACGSYADSATITFLPRADGFLPNDSVYCSEIPFYVLNPQTNGVSYQWHDGTDGPQYRIDSSQTVSLLSFSACDTLNDTFNVEFVPLPYTDLGRDTAICLNDEFVLYPTTNSTGQDLHFGWNDGSTDSILLVTDTGLYSVIVTLKGCVVRDSIVIFQRGDCYDGCKPRLANIITPNADGMNDEFASFLDCPLEAYQLQIFNRWGQVVFTSTEPSFRWDGSINGESASEGTYFYSLRFTPRATNKEVEYRGSVMVVQ